MLLNDIEKIVGKGNYSDSESTKTAYALDASTLKGEVKVVVWPTQDDQIQKLVKLALFKNLDIVPRGAGTGLVGAVVPMESIVMDFSRMNHITKIDTKEKIVTVEPGVVVADLNKTLAQYDLFFPVIPSSQAVCTIGGMVACNAVGLKAVKYGKTDKWVKEITLVDGNGKLNILKDNKSVKEICGTEGVLGAITEIKLKLTEMPKPSTITIFKFNTNDELITKVNSIDTEKGVLSVEFMDKLSSNLIGMDKKIHLFIEYDNDMGEIKTETEVQSIMTRRKGLGPALITKGYPILQDPLIHNAHIIDFLDWLEEKGIPCFGHIAKGVIHPHFKKEELDLVDEMYEKVKEFGGEVTGEHGIGIAKKKWVKPEFIEKIKILKKQYDPSGVFNRGKIL